MQSASIGATSNFTSAGPIVSAEVPPSQTAQRNLAFFTETLPPLTPKDKSDLFFCWKKGESPYEFTRTRNTAHLERLRDSAAWIAELSASERRCLLLRLAKDWNENKSDPQNWWFESQWFEGVSREMISLLKHGLVEPSIKKDLFASFQAPPLDPNTWERGATIAWNIILGQSIVIDVAGSQVIKDEIQHDLRNRLEQTRPKDIRIALDLLYIHYGDDATSFIRELDLTPHVACVARQWDQEISIEKATPEYLRNIRGTVVSSVPYVADGGGDVVACWEAITFLKQKLPRTEFVLVVSNHCITRGRRLASLG